MFLANSIIEGAINFVLFARCARLACGECLETDSTLDNFFFEHFKRCSNPLLGTTG